MPTATPLNHTLPNGVTLLAAPMPHLASASVAIFIRAGSRDESADKAGVSHFLEHMAFKGTHTRTVQALNFAAESLGADMNAYTDKDATCYHLEGLGVHTPQMLELLARHPDKLVAQKQLLREVWGPAYESETGYLRVHLANLRRKLEPDPSRPRYLITEPGIGYRFTP